MNRFDDDEWVPVRGIAAMFGCAKDTIYRLIRDGELDARDIGREGSPRIRVSKQSAKAFLDRRKVTVAKESA